MSMARFWRNQQQAFELLAPVYGWFTDRQSTQCFNTYLSRSI